MVQILPTSPTAAGQFGAGLGAGLSQTLGQRLNQFYDDLKSKKQAEKVQSLFESLPEGSGIQERMNALLTSGLPAQTLQQGMEILRQQGAEEFSSKFTEGQMPTLADVIRGSSLGYIPPGIGQDLAREIIQTQAYERFFPKEITQESIEKSPGEEAVEISTMEEKLPTSIPPVTASGRGWEKYEDEDLSKMVGLGGKLGTAARTELSRRQKETEREYKKQESSEKKRQFAHKETASYANSLRENAENAREVLQAVNEVKRIAATGKTGVSARNLLQSFLASRKSFLTPALIDQDRQSLISATKGLAGGFRSLFGARPTQKEFFWYENILPNILKDAATNVKAAEYLGKVANINLKRQEIADDIVSEHEGYRPIDLDRRVRTQLKPEMDRIVKEGEALSSKLEKMEKKKPFSLRKVERGTPITEDVVRELLEYTDQDPDKARKMAVQLGYSVESNA